MLMKKIPCLKPSPDSQESLTGNVHSRWDPTRIERRYAYGGDASVKFSGVRHIEWNPIEWKDKLLKANHLGQRTPTEKMKAAVYRIMAMNRAYKGITSPPAEWQVEVERQRAGRQAEELRRLKMEKERVERAKKESRIGRKDARANARLERQARIEKELMQQNTQAQLLVENMEEALLKVPELRPPIAPELHPNELFQAKMVIHDLATSDLGAKVSELAGDQVAASHKQQNGKVLHWDPVALNNWLAQVQSHATEKATPKARTFYPMPEANGLLLQPVYPLDDLRNQPWYPTSDQWKPQVDPQPEATMKDAKVWL